MKVAGVDCNKSKVAVALLDLEEGKLLLHVVEEDIPLRANQLYHLARRAALVLEAADLVFIEEAPIGRGVRASLSVAQTTGAVAAYQEQKTYFIPVKTWKKAVVGNGNAGKSDVSAWLNHHNATYSEQCDGDQDLIDATCISLYGARVHAVATSLGVDGH